MFVTYSAPIPAQASLLTGNIVWVDRVNGDDATAVRGNAGFPFLTVQAALTNALSGDIVQLRPGIYDLPAAGISIPAGVTLRGLSSFDTTLQILGALAATTALTISGAGRVEDVTVHLTSALDVNLTGVLFSGASSATGKLRRMVITVDNTTAPGLAPSQVVGILVQSNGAPGRQTNAVRAVTSQALSVGPGKKRGMLMNTLAGMFSVRDINVLAQGGADCIGSEIDIAGGTLTHITGTVQGDTADVSQITGSLELGAVFLVNSTSNGRNFLSIVQTGTLVWADIAAVPAGPVFLRPGTAATTAVEADAQIRIAKNTIIKTLAVHAGVAPGGVATCTVTVRKNGVDTTLTAQLVGAATTVLNLTNAVTFMNGDLLSLSIADTGVTQDPTVTLELH